MERALIKIDHLTETVLCLEKINILLAMHGIDTLRSASFGIHFFINKNKVH